MRLGIVGGGFMGEAFLRGLLREGIAAPGEVVVAEVSAARRDELSGFGVALTAEAGEACESADVVLLAVKPQDVATVGASIRGLVPEHAVIVSIAAGVRVDDVVRDTGHAACVRVMPNLPAAIGQGAAVVRPAPGVSAEQMETVRRIVDAVSSAVIEAADDDAVDLATAVNGSGPAYVFMLIEAMIDAAVRLGMKRPEATELVQATVSGAAAYAVSSGQHAAELRNAVTSPGGTTAAALAALEAHGMRAAIDDAIEAAYLRAVELGG